MTGVQTCALPICKVSPNGFLAAGLTLGLVVAPGPAARADAASGRIVVAGDEWPFSDDGLPHNTAYVNNVLKWFALAPNGAGKKVLILDGQSWNGGYNGTYGAFGSSFRNLLTGLGVAVTYLGYQDNLVPLSGYDAVFADGLMVKAGTLTNDLATFFRAGGAVYVAGGTGTFSPATPTGDASYWQPFLTAATGSGDFGLAGGTAWISEYPPLDFTGPIGNGVTNLDWYMGQGVQVGTNANASAAIWDSQRTLVATWSPPFIFINRQNTNVIVSWTGSHVLQTATNVAGPYGDVQTAASPFTNRIDPNLNRFYRLR